MPDDAPPPAPPPEPEPSNSTTTGLPSNLAAALASIPLIGGIVFYVLEKHDRFVRFYAMQSIILGLAFIVAWIVYAIFYGILSPIPGIGFVFAIILQVAWGLIRVGVLVLFVIMVVKAFTGVRWDIPYIGPIARKQVDGGV